MSSSGELVLALPEWLRPFASDAAPAPALADRMALVIDLARRNVEQSSGGPFAAAVFELPSGRLVGVGVNRVVPSRTSIAHAEILALGLAQQRLGQWDLGAPGLPPFELVASTEPCAMCLGAVVWSGVRRLVCGARDADARGIGFDEGPKSGDWVEELAARGVDVEQDVCREAAVAVLRAYADGGGLIYNARQGAPPPRPEAGGGA
ncbi:MAG TPA: nucleoside deaminase [Thermoanaerobaculia bacterium]|nr:nucleoside deaminase [Thermoanaerobaculia bacterium]